MSQLRNITPKRIVEISKYEIEHWHIDEKPIDLLNPITRLFQNIMTKLIFGSIHTTQIAYTKNDQTSFLSLGDYIAALAEDAINLQRDPIKTLLPELYGIIKTKAHKELEQNSATFTHTISNFI